MATNRITPNPDGTCPLPPKPAQPGLIDPKPGLPAPPKANTSPTTPGQDPNRPPAGSPEEGPWIIDTITTIKNDGPSFGPRKDEYLPYLVMRANSSDAGARPLNDVFWESPDIFVTPYVDAASAPLSPATTNGMAVASVPNTLYAHVWNLGNSPAYNVRVEFWWCNPSLGITRAVAHLIGAAYVDLGSRYAHNAEWKTASGPSGQYLTRGAHAIVRCPVTWTPTFENDGHECLVVRVFDFLKDGLSPDEFSAASNRHVGQRNISVAIGHSPAVLDALLDLGYPRSVGTMTVDVQAGPPSSSEFLTLFVGKGGTPLVPSTAPLTAGVRPPVFHGESVDPTYRQSQTFSPGCERGTMQFHAESDVKPGEGHVIRVRQHAGGKLIGGCTMILMKPSSGGGSGADMARCCLYGSAGLTIADRVKTIDGRGGFAPVVCTGNTGINVGVQSLVGSLYSKGPVQIRNYGCVYGDVHSPNALVDLQSGASVKGKVVNITGTTLPTFKVAHTFATNVPPPTNIGPDGDQSLSPGTYGNVSVYSRSTLHLTAGTYSCESLAIEPQTTISCDCSAGPILIYVHGECHVRGDFVEKNGKFPRVMLAVFGANGISLERPFTGVVAAPQGTLNLATINGQNGKTSFLGAFYGKNVTVQPDNVVQFVPIDGIPAIVG